MKTTSLIFLFLILSLSGQGHAQQDAAPTRLVARMMGDLMFLQIAPDKDARRAAESRLDELEALMTKTDRLSDKTLWSMVEAMSRALHYLDKSNILGNDEMQKVLSSYENFFESNFLRTRKDAAFLILDLRFRYLARTAVSPYGLMTVPPLRNTIEDVQADADVAVTAEATRQNNPTLQRDWNFLKRLVAQYNSHPAPRMVESLSIRLCQKNRMM